MAKRSIKMIVEDVNKSVDFEDLPDDWDEKTEDEQANHLAELAHQHMENTVEYFAEVIENPEDDPDWDEDL